MPKRTDLVMEKTADNSENITGVDSRNYEFCGCKIFETEVKTDFAAKALEKPKGQYFTLCFDRFENMADVSDIKPAIIKILKKIVVKQPTSAMLVGLGNSDITTDALGPLCIDKILSTRHLGDDIKSSLGLQGLRCVSTVIPRVLGKTGIEASELVFSLVNSVKPDLIIVIDALAAANRENLCRTFQFTDTGISPGSGVDNKRKELSEKTLGVPVISIGMPTVIDDCGVGNVSMMVTPKEIDMYVKTASEVLANSLNEFLQPFIPKDMLSVLA